jgi:hypothetical protein
VFHIGDFLEPTISPVRLDIQVNLLRGAWLTDLLLLAGSK